MIRNAPEAMRKEFSCIGHYEAEGVAELLHDLYS